jgi:hypothetical protein
MEKLTRCYRYAIVPSAVQRKGTPTRKEQREASSRRRILRCVSPCNRPESKAKAGDRGMEQTL